MPLTKPYIIDAIAQQDGFTRKKSIETVETILEIIKSILAVGNDVLISKFCKFCVKENESGEDGIQRPEKILWRRRGGL